MAAGSAVCSYGVYDHHRPSLPLQLLSRSPPVSLRGLLSNWGLKRGESHSLPSSFPPPSWHNQRNTESRKTDFPAARSPPTAFKFLASVKRPYPEIKGPNSGGCHSQIGIVMARPLAMMGCCSGVSPLTSRNLICGHIIQAANSAAERRVEIDLDEYDDGECEYEERRCGGEDDEEEASQGDDDCSEDEFNDSGCQYVDEDDNCDGTAVQFFVDALSDDDNADGDNEDIAALKHSKSFETCRTPFMTHLSVESGYVENLSDSACTPDTGTTEDEFDDFDDSECECTESTEADNLWKSFEEQAFFVADCSKARTVCKNLLSLPQVKCPTSPPSAPLCDFHKGGVSTSIGAEGLKGVQGCGHTDESATPSCCDAGSRRRVSFKPDSELVEVHHMITWNFAYRSCRKGPWEQFVIDRNHFQRRAEEFGKIFEPCFAKRKQQNASLP